MHTETHISDKLYNLCRSDKSISNALLHKPAAEIALLSKELYGSHSFAEIETKPPKERTRATAEDLQRALQCGRFEGTQPSELFLRAYHDILLSVQHDPLAGVVSPSMLGSTGVVPMTVIGPLVDTVRHMSNLIARAKREVFFATCSWKVSGPTTMIGEAIKELSRRAGERGEKAVVKIMFDRGNLKQFFDNHQLVTPKEWISDAIKLPAAEEIPHVDLQVINYHRPALGTFHSKFMIVDRQMACVASNNIEDNDNTEMMSHLEGPIVDCLWDTFLVSWHKAMTPPPPSVDRTAASLPLPTFQEATFTDMFNEQGRFRKPETGPAKPRIPEHMPGDPHYDDSISAEIHRMHSVLSPRNGETPPQIVARHLNQPKHLDLKATAPDNEPNLHYFPMIPLPPHSPVPMALCNRKPFGSLNHTSVYVPQNECFLSLIRNATRTIFIQTPDLNAAALLPALAQAVKRGVHVTHYVCLGYNDSGELLPGQNGTNEMAANRLMNDMLDTEEERARLELYFYVAADQDHPIHNRFKQRSCHIKLLIADESVAVQGSGNQDTQSWYQSQEVNVMVDSPLVCKAWREGIERNQNTRLFGRAAADGCWYGKDGKLAEGSLGTDPGRFAWMKGVQGAIKRAQGKGGF